MRLEQLEQVVEIRQWGSYNIAASYLHTTHQNLSRSIQKLEEELQTTIFLRGAKGAILTESGEQVYNFAMTVMNEYHKLCSQLNQHHPKPKTPDQPLKVALTASLDLVLKPLLYNLSYDSDYFSLDCRELNMMDCVHAAGESADYDLIFLQNDYQSFLEHSKPAANYRLFILNAEKIELITSKSSPYAQHALISRELLKSIPLMCYSHDSAPTNIAQVCLNKNIPLHIVSYTNISSFLQEMMVFGNTHTIAVPFAQQSLWSNPMLKDQLVAIPIDLPFKIASAVWVKKEFSETALGEKIIHILRQAYHKTVEEIY